MIRTVKVGADEFAFLYDYENELDLEADTPEDEFGATRISYVLTMYQMPCGRTLHLTNLLTPVKLGWTPSQVLLKLTGC